MARFLIHSDFHFYHNWPEFNQLEANGLPRMLNKQLDTYREIEEVCLEWKVDYKLFCGDLVHKRSFVHTSTFLSLLKLYREHRIPEIMIGGNHDRYDQTRSVIQMLEGIPGITILNHGERVALDGVDIYGLAPGAEVIKIDENPNRKSILLAHGSIIGAKTPTGFEMTSGYKVSDFEQFDLVSIGDIHKRQIHQNVLIPGTPIGTNWGEAENVPGVYLIDSSCHFEHGEFFGLGGFAAQFIPLKTPPRWIVVDQGNFEAVLKDGSPENHYDFRAKIGFTRGEISALRERFPYSIYRAPKTDDSPKSARKTLSNTGGPRVLLTQYVALKQLDFGPLFIEMGERYLQECLPKSVAQGGSQIDFLWMKAENFMAFKEVEFRFDERKHPVYIVTGKTDSSSTVTNGAAKSTFAVEILCYTLFDQVARSSSRGKDSLIHNSAKLEKPSGLFTEVGLAIGGVTYKIQRYRKHSELGSGCRILKEKL